MLVSSLLLGGLLVVRAVFGGDNNEKITSSSSTSNIVCDDSQECSGDTISTTLNIYCRGYLGCSSATLSAGLVAYCDGDYGCYQATITGDSEVRCQGAYSCAYSTVSYSGDKLQVYGAEGVRNATVYGNGDGSTLFYPYGFYASRYAKIYNISTIYGYGLYGLAYSKIYSTGLTSMNVYSLGLQAGYSARVYCYSGSTCYVDCGDEYGCNQMKIYCYSGATCSYSCDSDCSSSSCPTEYSVTSENLMYAVENEYGIKSFNEFVKYYDQIADGYEKIGHEKELAFKKMYPNNENKAYDEFNKWFENYCQTEDEKFFGRLKKWGYKNQKASSATGRSNNVLDTFAIEDGSGSDNYFNFNNTQLWSTLGACVIAFAVGILMTILCGSKFTGNSKTNNKENGYSYGTLA